MNLNSLGIDYRKGTKPNNIYVCCPLCETRGKTPDTKFKMGVNTKTGLYHCFRCGASTKTTGKIHSLEQLSFLVDVKNTSNRFHNLRERLSKRTMFKALEEVDLKKISWPLSRDMTPIAYDYLVNERHFTEEMLKKYQIHVGREFFDEDRQKLSYIWAGRILFPLFENGKCVFICGRSYNGRNPKYRNTNKNKNKIIYGLDRVRNQEAILCEGVIDTIAAETYSGVSAVCGLGKTLTEWQLIKLRTKVKTVYQCLDGEVSKKEKEELNKQLISHGFTVYQINLPEGKDPDDLRNDFKTYFDRKTKVSWI